MRCQTTHRADRIAAALVLLSVLSKFYAFTRLAFTVHCTALGIGRLGIWGEGGAAITRLDDLTISLKKIDRFVLRFFVS